MSHWIQLLFKPEVIKSKKIKEQEKATSSNVVTGNCIKGTPVYLVIAWLNRWVFQLRQLQMFSERLIIKANTVELERRQLLPAVLRWMLTCPSPSAALTWQVYSPSSLCLTLLSNSEAFPWTKASGKSWVLPLNCKFWSVKSAAPL